MYIPELKWRRDTLQLTRFPQKRESLWLSLWFSLALSGSLWLSLWLSLSHVLLESQGPCSTHSVATAHYPGLISWSSLSSLTRASLLDSVTLKRVRRIFVRTGIDGIWIDGAEDIG